jgi:ABC-type nitrate/sulfonate/bicarbonate transport system substrate-binding protein
MRMQQPAFSRHSDDHGKHGSQSAHDAGAAVSRRSSVRRAVARVGAVATLAVAMWPFQASAQGNAPASLEKVVIRFTWKLYGVYAPLYVALDKGYFAEEGLAVELAEGSGSENVVRLIATGTDKISFGTGVVAAEAISAGLPIKVIANYMPNHPLGLISFPDVALNTPKDLEGKTVGLATGETFSNMLEPFAKLNGVDLSKVKRVQFDGATRNAQFVARKIDVISVYLNNDLPLLANKLNVKFNTLNAAEFGLALMGTSYFVNLDYMKERPETLRKILRATAKGYAEAFKNPKEATEMLNKRMAIKMDPAMLETQVTETLAATARPVGKPLGWQEEALWKSNLDLLKAGGRIRETKDYSTYYTNEFLQ